MSEENSTKDVLRFLLACMSFYAQVEPPKEEHENEHARCNYCSKRSENTIKISLGSYKICSIEVCEDHLKILEKIKPEDILNNQLWKAERLQQYLEYIENTDPEKLGPITLSKSKQKPLEE